MRRREFLQATAGIAGLSSVGVAAGLSSTETTTAHPGPYRPLGSVDIPNATEAVPDDEGKFAYVAAMDGLVVVDIAVPSDPQIVAERRNLFADRETGPLRQIQDVKVEGDTLILPGPADPKQGEVLQGMAVYDVSDPENPERVGFHETDYPIHNCDLRDGVAYLTGNNDAGNPLVAVDVSGDEPTEIGRWSMLDYDEAWSEVAPGLRNLHDVYVRDGRAYLAQWDAGTWILDVSDPANPQYVAQVGGRPRDELAEVPEEDVRAHVLRLPGNDHFSMPNEDGTLLGIDKEAWQVNGEGGPGGVELWDISNVDSPERLSTIAAPPSPDPSIGGVWTTSHNFDIVGDRLFTSWYQGGVKIHDISDPANPEQLTWWRDPEATSFWTAKAATDRFFIGGSMGRRENGRGGLYTFPNHPGEQKDPPLTTTADGTAETTTATTTQQSALGEGTTTTEKSSSSGVPGFGIPSAVAALLGAGAWRRLRD